jgi:hypothetical protein
VSRPRKSKSYIWYVVSRQHTGQCRLGMVHGDFVYHSSRIPECDQTTTGWPAKYRYSILYEVHSMAWDKRSCANAANITPVSRRMQLPSAVPRTFHHLRL